MKRVLLVGVILTMLSGCGGSPTAVGNVVATVPSPTPTPTENAAAAPDNVAVPDDSVTTNDTSANTTASSDAQQE